MAASTSPLAFKDTPTIVMCRCVLRIKSDSFGVVLDGILDFPFFHSIPPTTSPTICTGWIQSNLLSVEIKSLLGSITSCCFWPHALPNHSQSPFTSPTIAGKEIFSMSIVSVPTFATAPDFQNTPFPKPRVTFLCSANDGRVRMMSNDET